MLQRPWHQRAGLRLQFRARADVATCRSTRVELLKLVEDTKPTGRLRYDQNGRSNNDGWIGANKLLRNGDCWTYKDRFDRYLSMPKRYFLHNECNRIQRTRSVPRTAIVIRVGESTIWSQDLKLSIRAMVSELGWKLGMDVFVLQHVAVHKSRTSNLPSEFEAFTMQFTMNELVTDYNATIIEPIPNPPMKIPIISQFNHMAETYFMRKFPEYEFAWFVENDVRLTGRWDLFLEDVEAAMNATMLTRTTDLITFTPSYKVNRTWLWANSLAAFPLEALTMTLLQLHRISRGLAMKMHESHLAGRNAYFEGYVSTVATMNNMTKLVFANPVFANSTPAFTGRPFTGIANVVIGSDRMHKQNLWVVNAEDPQKTPNGTKKEQNLFHGATYSPLDVFSRTYYQQWQSRSFVCRPYSLVHPVKNA